MTIDQPPIKIVEVNTGDFVGTTMQRLDKIEESTSKLQTDFVITSSRSSMTARAGLAAMIAALGPMRMPMTYRSTEEILARYPDMEVGAKTHAQGKRARRKWRHKRSQP